MPDRNAVCSSTWVFSWDFHSNVENSAGGKSRTRNRWNLSLRKTKIWLRWISFRLFMNSMYLSGLMLFATLICPVPFNICRFLNLSLFYSIFNVLFHSAGPCGQDWYFRWHASHASLCATKRLRIPPPTICHRSIVFKINAAAKAKVRRRKNHIYNARIQDTWIKAERKRKIWKCSPISAI